MRRLWWLLRYRLPWIAMLEWAAFRHAQWDGVRWVLPMSVVYALKDHGVDEDEWYWLGWRACRDAWAMERP